MEESELKELKIATQKLSENSNEPTMSENDSDGEYINVLRGEGIY